MRIAPVNVTWSAATSVSMAATSNSDAQQVQWAFGYSICATYTGTPVGTLKLQASVVSGSGATWVDIDGSSTSISAAGSTLWNVTDVMYSAFRLVYTRTSGTGTLTGEILYKGN